MKFIVFEGLDGSGGTTQVDLLRRWLFTNGGVSVVETREPTRAPIGSLITKALKGLTPISDHALPYLFAADRRDHIDLKIRPALKRGAWVVSDRYALSSLAYQSAAIGFDRVVDLNQDILTPDLTIFLDLSPEACMERISKRGEAKERFEELKILSSVREYYMRGLNLRKFTGDTVIIDASLSIKEVQLKVQEACLPYMRS